MLRQKSNIIKWDSFTYVLMEYNRKLYIYVRLQSELYYLNNERELYCILRLFLWTFVANTHTRTNITQVNIRVCCHLFIF